MKAKGVATVAQVCEACQTLGTEVETRVIEGITVVCCIDPVACRRLGEAAGIWGVVSERKS